MKDADSKEPYRFLGDFNAAPGYAAVGLQCDICKVEWVGCWDNAACPECGDHAAWHKLMEARGHYKQCPPLKQLNDWKYEPR